MPKILVVDDNEQLSSMLKDVLESWGYTALTATEGRSCLEIARQEQPDIILLDIMLPGLSGYEVCSELKRDGRTHSGSRRISMRRIWFIAINCWNH